MTAWAPVGPHVLDLWCAWLVAWVVVLIPFVVTGRLLNKFRSLKFAVSGWFKASSPGRDTHRELHRHFGVGHLSRWWMILISLLLLHRGEALNPGPVFDEAVKAGRKRTWSMGTFNPSGLGGKHQVLSSYLNHGNLWAVTETHLSSQGMKSFRQGLKWSDSEFSYCIGGKPVPLRSHSCATGIGMVWQSSLNLPPGQSRLHGVTKLSKPHECNLQQLCVRTCGSQEASCMVSHLGSLTQQPVKTRIHLPLK